MQPNPMRTICTPFFPKSMHSSLTNQTLNYGLFQMSQSNIHLLGTKENCLVLIVSKYRYHTCAQEHKQKQAPDSLHSDICEAGSRGGNLTTENKLWKSTFSWIWVVKGLGRQDEKCYQTRSLATVPVSLQDPTQFSSPIGQETSDFAP